MEGQSRKTQGLLFFGARSSFYPEIPCYGAVITARCDFAQNKVRNVHFVSVVPIVEWVLSDCAKMIGEDIRESTQKSIKKTMSRLELNPNLFADLGPEKCERVIFSYETNTNTRETIAKEFNKWKLANKIENGLLLRDEIGKLLTDNPEFAGKKKEKINLILDHKLNGYYFLSLPRITSSTEGLVANFRDIQTLTMQQFFLLLDRKLDCRNPEILTDKELCAKFFFNTEEDFAVDIGILPSPDIEHFMQSFALLYSRIGIDGVSDEIKSAMRECSLV